VEACLGGTPRKDIVTAPTPELPANRVLAALAPRGQRILSFRDLAKGLLGPSADEASLEALRAEVDALERKGSSSAPAARSSPSSSSRT
jgi:hypothetical protein